MGKVIVVTSGKGGVGKSTTVANLGTALAAKDKKVLLVDADIGLRNLDIILGVDDKVVYDFVDVLEGRCRLAQAIIKDKRYEELYILAASQTKDKTDVTPEQMIKLCDELRQSYDFVIIDCPAGVEQGFELAAAPADCAIVVTVPERTALRDADRITEKLEAMGIEQKWVVVNKIRTSIIKNKAVPKMTEIIETLAIDFLGAVPDDEKVVISAASGKTVTGERKSRAGEAYRNIAGRLLGENIPMLKIKGLKRGGNL
ncbi:MAG: septum site-determining protein MinD [Clostridia bacterium]|nr:septum site-determining protein MinD [Clostridia bacterium]